MTQFEKDPPSHMAVPGSRRRSLLTGIAMGILLLLTGGAWALASPPGSSPDDNFHLPSIWCAWSPEATGCTIDPATADTSRPYASIPALQGTDVECHKFRPDVSAACQFDPDTPPGTTTVDNGLYPDGFYAVLRVLASDEAGASVVAMRMLVFTLCVGILAWAGFLLRAPDRYRVWLIWVAAALPLGVFLFASTNPSSTTIAGVTAAGTAVYAGGLADTKSRRIGSIALAILATAIALGSRAEASFFLIVAIAAGLVLHGRFWRLGRRLLLPAGASIASRWLAWCLRNEGGSRGGGWRGRYAGRTTPLSRQRDHGASVVLRGRVRDDCRLAGHAHAVARLGIGSTRDRRSHQVVGLTGAALVGSGVGLSRLCGLGRCSRLEGRNSAGRSSSRLATSFDRAWSHARRHRCPGAARLTPRANGTEQHGVCTPL